MAAGLIRDVPTVKKSIGRIMLDAGCITRGRLVGLLDGTAETVPRAVA